MTGEEQKLLHQLVDYLKSMDNRLTEILAELKSSKQVATVPAAPAPAPPSPMPDNRGKRR